MTSRRSFLGTTAAMTVGVAGARAMAGKYSGPHEMPTNVTLLSMQDADGSETLGVKLDDDAVLDVRKAAHLLGMAAPLTLEELLREGNAGGPQQACRGRKDHPPGQGCDGEGVLHYLRQVLHESRQDRVYRAKLPGPCRRKPT